jgi:hypothetical protein
MPEESSTDGAGAPRPRSTNVWVPLLSKMTSTAARTPVLLGVKVMLILHFPSAASELPQSSARVKSLASGPEIATLAMRKGVSLLFVSITV